MFTLGLAINLPLAPRLGLWADDFVQFLQAHHAANGNNLAFVLDDSTGYLAGGERPAGYLVFAVARLAYLAGVGPLHILTAAFAAIAAALLARFSRHFFAERGGAIAAGAFVLLWPLAPLVQFFPSTIHYSSAAAVSILAAEAALSNRRASCWLAGALHLAACTTLEFFVFAAPAFALAALISERIGLVSRRSSAPRRTWGAIGTMTGASAVVLVWRLAVVPRFDAGVLRYENKILSLREAAGNLLRAPEALLWPWRKAASGLRELEAWRPTSFRLLVVAGLAVAAAYLLSLQRPDGQRPDRSSRSRGRTRLYLWVPGAALTLFWMLQLSFVPGAFEDEIGVASRLHYPAIFAVALFLGGAFASLCGADTHLALRATASGLLLTALVAGGRVHENLGLAHARDWAQTSARIEQIAVACPSLAPGTLIIVDTSWPTTLMLLGKVGMSQQVLSSLLIARYDDPSLLGVRREELRAIPGGVRVLDFGAAALWFPPGTYGVAALQAQAVLPPVRYERIVTLAPVLDGRLAQVPFLNYPHTRDRKQEIWGHPERCVSRWTPPSPAFCHAFYRACTGGPG